MARIKWGAWGVLILISSAAVAAEISALPSPGKSVGVVTADQVGKWLVMTVDRQTFYFRFPDLTLLDGGKVCVWEGSAGVYGVVFDGADGTRQTTNVVLGGMDPIPPPPPPPPPPPSPMPDGLWSLTKTAYQQSRDSALPADQVVKVAANYTDVADQILAGKITTDASREGYAEVGEPGRRSCRRPAEVGYMGRGNHGYLGFSRRGAEDQYQAGRRRFRGDC